MGVMMMLLRILMRAVLGRVVEAGRSRGGGFGLSTDGRIYSDNFAFIPKRTVFQGLRLPGLARVIFFKSHDGTP